MFTLDLRGHKSIYEQITDGFKEMIMTGALACGEKMPSVRELSKNLGVNPNTIQKAYRELERQGYVYTATGVGTFVADKENISVDPKELEHIKEVLWGGFKELLFLGLDYDEALKIAEELFAERRKDL